MSNLPSVSVIVPALNEAGNIHALISRTEAALFQKATYEIIVIDDRSTDGTAGIVAELGRFSDGRISVHTKQGKGGKAYSLLEGFAYARDRRRRGRSQPRRPRHQLAPPQFL
jgi:dolichol-phosphate mannosyltransferase